MKPTIVNDPNLYQINKEVEKFMPLMASTFFYSVLSIKTQNGKDLAFITPSQTKKTGKRPNFATISRNCTWVEWKSLEVVNA